MGNSQRLDAAIPLGGRSDDDLISLLYNPADGHLQMEGGGKQITSMEILSAHKWFVGPDYFCPGDMSLCAEAASTGKRFIVWPIGLSDFDFGRVLQTGLTGEVLANDLTVRGSIKPLGRLGTVDLIVVPEPTGMAGWGTLGIAVAWRRRRR